MENEARAWETQDAELFTSCFTDGAVYEDVALSLTHRGHDELRHFLALNGAAFPDFVIEMKTVYANDHCGHAEWVMSGTHLGQMGPLPPTGKRFSVRGISALKFSGGKISRQTDYWNFAALLQQLGFMPASSAHA
jgi:steroid delta-isomerase-like uncharacterized protein